MASRRGVSKAGSASATLSAAPVMNAVMVGAAVCYGLTVLVSHGRMSWPPHQLLASLFTLSGCLAAVGPIVLARGEGEGGLGELLWMTGGLLVWVFDAVALVHGDWRSTAWVTPLGYQAMGLTILAVLLAGWRCRIAGRGWTWTNVTGWLLGLFWVGMALTTLWSSRSIGLTMR